MGGDLTADLSGFVGFLRKFVKKHLIRPEKKLDGKTANMV
jgi:hypothetical protein